LNTKNSLTADSIIEYVFTDNPDFNDPEALNGQIESGTLKFIKDIKELLYFCPQ